jgi:hypothetical protein
MGLRKTCILSLGLLALAGCNRNSGPAAGTYFVTAEENPPESVRYLELDLARDNTYRLLVGNHQKAAGNWKEDGGAIVLENPPKDVPNKLFRKGKDKLQGEGQKWSFVRRKTANFPSDK